MAERPVVLPEPFNGEPESSWGDWSTHFDNVADVNEWSAEQKLKWLKVRLTRRAQREFQSLPETTRASFESAWAALKKRFEPETHNARYLALFQTRPAVPRGQGVSRPAAGGSRMAGFKCLQQLSHPHITFSVKQRRPMTLE